MCIVREKKCLKGTYNYLAEFEKNCLLNFSELSS